MRSRHRGLHALVAVGVVAICFAAFADPGDLIISQQHAMFTPTSISLHKGDAITIVNDDTGVLHHAYVESETFNFDSGDQKPGSRTKVVFSVPGDFQVLCGIHPKMKLAVHVR